MHQEMCRPFGPEPCKKEHYDDFILATLRAYGPGVGGRVGGLEISGLEMF
jgi:hypothetical protein